MNRFQFLGRFLAFIDRVAQKAYQHSHKHLSLSLMRPMGLKWVRLLEWRAVIQEEWREIGWREVVHMVHGSLFPKVKARIWRSRVRACYRCPLFDRDLKRCRPYTGSPYGCGCYVPYRLTDPRPCHREAHSRSE